MIPKKVKGNIGLIIKGYFNAPQDLSLIHISALGAACLAGLAVGFWKDKQEIIDNFKSGSQFTPTIDEEERRKLLEGWHRAIEAAMKF